MKGERDNPKTKQKIINQREKEEERDNQEIKNLDLNLQWGKGQSQLKKKVWRGGERQSRIFFPTMIKGEGGKEQGTTHKSKEGIQRVLFIFINSTLLLKSGIIPKKKKVRGRGRWRGRVK